MKHRPIHKNWINICSIPKKIPTFALQFKNKKFLLTMVNRILIRIKVLQIVYSYYQNGNGDLKAAENELLFSLRKSYDLYHYFLLLLIELTNLQRRNLDSRKSKYMPTEEELNPNTRFIDNRFIAQLAENEDLMKTIHIIKGMPIPRTMRQEFLLVMHLKGFFRYAVPVVWDIYRLMKHCLTIL